MFFRKILDVFNPADALKPGLFYAGINDSVTKAMHVYEEFVQGGGHALSGYLPSQAGGACSFTVLDFMRANTQDCVQEWCAHTRNFLTTSQHAARQAFLYKNAEERLRDPLFNLTQNKKLENLPIDYVKGLEIFRPVKKDVNESLLLISQRIYEIFHTFLNLHLTPMTDRRKNIIPISIFAPCIELAFNIQTRKGDYGHSTAFVLQPPGKQQPATLFFMDPNAGVIRLVLHPTVILELLLILKTQLYKDFTLDDLHLNQRRQWWIDKITPILNGETKIKEKEIHGIGAPGFKTREINFIKLLKKKSTSQAEPEPSGSLLVINEDDLEVVSKDFTSHDPMPINIAQEKAEEEIMFYDFDIYSHGESKFVSISVDVARSIKDSSIALEIEDFHLLDFSEANTNIKKI